MTHRATAIIAAYNEAPRIADVLKVVTSYPDWQAVIVIDDGSTDATGQVAQAFPIRYLKNEVNQGKGVAMDRAVAAADTDVIFFCDADVQGLTHDIIREVVAPVSAGKRDLSIAMRYHASLYRFPQLLEGIFWLGGERAITKKLWQQIPQYYKHQFRIEPALNFYASRYGRGLVVGVARGNRRRLAFMLQIIGTALRLRAAWLVHVITQRTLWPSPRSERLP